MYQQPRTLDVAQESNAQAGAFMRAFDQSRQVSDDIRSPNLSAFAASAAIRVHYAKVRLEGRKWIVRNLRPRRGNHGNERRLPRVRKADQSHVGQQPQLQSQVTFFAGKPVLMFPRSLVPRLRKILISAPAAPALRNQHSLPRRRQIRDRLAAIVEHEGAHRHPQNHVVARMPRTVRAFSVAPAICFELAIVAIAQQRVVVRIRFQVNAAAMPAIAAGRPAARHEFLAPKGLAACWVETGSTFTGYSFAMTAGSILVKHPVGDLLVDTGNSSHFDDEISGYPFLLRLTLKNLAGQLNPEVPLPELMRLVGGDPAKIRWVILSHVHLDHAGGLMDLPRVPVLLTREELQFAFDPAVQAKGFVIPAHTQRFPPTDAPTLKFDPHS